MKTKKGRAKKILLGILLGYILIIGIGYTGVAFYFSSHFLKGTTVFGIDSSNLTAEEVKEQIQSRISEYKLRITELDGKVETITGPQVNLTYVDDSKVDQLLEKQENWKWITAFSSNKTYELTANTTYDQSTLDGIMDDMSCFQEENIIAPQDAYLKENETSYEIVPEVEGNTLDREMVKSALIDALDTGKTEIDLAELGCYLKPTIYQDNETLVAERDLLNKYLSTDLTYDFGGREEKVGAAQVKEWLTKDDEGQWTIDEDGVAAYVQELAYKYDTFGLTHKFRTHAGNTITLKGGDYGWVIKKTDTKDALIAAIKEGQTGTIEPVYLYRAMDRSENDIGGTYVEISIQEQRMWCYEDGVLKVDTPVVTGNPNKEGCETPSGSVWAIDAKKSPATLGTIDTMGYSSPVTFWMPFVENVGIHDADGWRSEYGGDLYLTNGSHGCVNTPYDAAEKIYNIVEIGTPVIVY